MKDRKLRQNEGGPTRRCLDCGQMMVGGRKTYHYKECGLSTVRLADVLVFSCVCGAEVPEIQGIRQLHHVIALELIQKETALSPEEIRFLRRTAGFSQVELAQIMGVDKTRPSKWEAGTPLSRESDRLLRSCCMWGMVAFHTDADKGLSKILSAADLVRKVDIVKILKRIVKGKPRPKPVLVESSASAGWVIPSPESELSVH